MSKISRRGLRIAAVAGAGVIAVAAWATTAHAGPVDSASSAMKSSPFPTRVALAPMPQGTVTFGRDRHGDVEVTVNAWGLTPGSSHKVELTNGRTALAVFSPLTANSTGQARDETLGSHYAGSLASLHVAILCGDGAAPLARTRIARTASYASGRRTYQLIPTEASANGTSYGTLKGSVVVTYDPSAQTISVTVNADGFTPGAHAAHIHDGSCKAQGPVQYMVNDYTANAHGQIVNETRVITHVATPLPGRGWYFNLHQGNGGDIVANGIPTLNFRPLLCADIAP